MKCKKHPNYKGLRKPTVKPTKGCSCHSIYELNELIKRVDAIEIDLEVFMSKFS